jgi:indolepyruvate ferredoxin oxidoreductase, alpha subunit
MARHAGGPEPRCGSERLLSGNEAIARGAWEAGVLVGAGYPGTPSTEILEALSALSGVHCEWSPNEKVALEVAVGAALAGGRALATMKHVGLNVAADPLFSVAYMGVNGGLVVVTADDPGMHSSQNEQDNRYFARAARIPMLEPATPAEARRYTLAAFELSERHDTPVLLRTVTRLSHGTGQVEVGERAAVLRRPYRKDVRKNVVLPAHGRVRHRMIEERRIPALAAESERWVEVHEGPGDLAVITAGVPYLYVREAFPTASVLKLGMTYPLPTEAIRRFSVARERIVVIEELEPLLEEQIRGLRVPCEFRRLPRHGELGVELLREMVGGAAPAAIVAAPPLPPRPPVLCPGCSHRGTFYALAQHGAIVSGDIGCYTLGALAPLNAMDTCLSMGASIGMAHGMERVLEEEERKRLVAVIGDSTFHHSGVPGLVDVVYNGGASTVVVLDNRTTAMTGHQDHPGSGHGLDGGAAPAVDLPALARAVGVRDVRRLDPYDLSATWRELGDAMASPYPALLIAEAPCVLKEATRFGGAITLDPSRCTDCQACTRVACPAIGATGLRLTVDPLLCTGCTHCQQVCADCHAGIDVAHVLELVARGEYDRALSVLLVSNPLPATSARVCPHPCEREVNALGWPQAKAYAARHPELAARFDDGRISPRVIERFLGDRALRRPPAPMTGTPAGAAARVAVVGSGPGGLSAAWQLRRAGHDVTVLESGHAPGGMLRHGIPDFRLPREVLDGELARLAAAGITIRCGVRVGRDVAFDTVAKDHDAVVLAVGRSAPAAARLKGSDTVAAGVVHGLDLLAAYNGGDRPVLGERVMVIGGGNTAVDCARVATRLGARAEIVYRRSRGDMPAIPDELADAEADGVTLRVRALPVSVRAGADGRLAAVEVVDTVDGPRDASGRSRPVIRAGSERWEGVDTLVLATGEEADVNWLAESGVAVNGRIDVNYAGATSRAGVFACGDAAFGHGTVTQAVSTGRRAAEAAIAYLDGRGGA